VYLYIGINVTEITCCHPFNHLQPTSLVLNSHLLYWLSLTGIMAVLLITHIYCRACFLVSQFFHALEKHSFTTSLQLTDINI